MNKIERNSNIELLRIIAMLFIIGLHFWSYSKASEALLILDSVNSNIFIFTESFMICGVNLFVMISSWFLTDSYDIKIRKIINLVLEVAIWGVIGSILAIVIFHDSFNFKEIIKTMFPVITGGRWFVKSYIIYILLLPFVNIALHNMDEGSHKKLLIITLFLFSLWPSFIPIPPAIDDYGYGFTNFIFIYILIFYIKKYIKNYPSKKLCIIGYILFSFMVFVSYKAGLGLSWGYNYFFVIGSALCLFLLFLQFNINSKIINKLASCAFGVFLIHTDQFFGELIYGNLFHATEALKYDGLYLLVTLITCMIFFYSMGFILEYIRKLLCTKTLDVLLNKVKSINHIVNIK